MSIGEVLGQLRPDFADITISKIRFLEAEGLVEPERTASGYRKFSREDVGRLRYVLTAQRDHYLPLRVIKEHLDAIDRGLEPPALGGGGPKVPRALVAAEGLPGPDAFRPDASEIRLSRASCSTPPAWSPSSSTSSSSTACSGPRPGSSHYDGDALVVAKTVAEMAPLRHRGPAPAARSRRPPSARSAWSSRSSPRWCASATRRPGPAPRRSPASWPRCRSSCTRRWSRPGSAPGLRR